MSNEARPVRVFYFPKGRRGRTRSAADMIALGAGHTTASGVVPASFTSFDETVTEPDSWAMAIRTESGVGELTKVAGDPRLGASGGRIILGGAAARPRESAPPPKRRPVVDLALGTGSMPQAQMVEELIIARDPIAALQGLSRKQLNELALVGHKLFERGKIAQARVVFEALVAVGMPDAFPYTMLGTVYLAQGNPSRALALFEAALRIDAKDIAARVYRGEIKAQSGKHKEALMDFDQVIRQGRKEDPFVERARQLTRMTGELAKKQR